MRQREYPQSCLLVEHDGATTAVPIHYDVFSADPTLFAWFRDIATVVSLGAGAATDL